MPTKTKKPKTMEFKELQRLSFCNSEKLPQYINVAGQRKQWVGIGWIDVKEPVEPEDIVIVEDGVAPKPVKLKRRRR